MADFDPETIVLETVRRQTGKESAGLKSRFAEDLGLSEEGRRSLFAYMVETFTAKGQNLPSRGFYLSDFLQCRTVGDAVDAIKSTLAGTRRPSRTAAKAGAPTTAAKAPAASSPPAPSAPTTTKPPLPGAVPSQPTTASKPGKSTGAPKKASGAKKKSKRR